MFSLMRESLPPGLTCMKLAVTLKAFSLALSNLLRPTLKVSFAEGGNILQVYPLGMFTPTIGTEIRFSVYGSTSYSTETLSALADAVSGRMRLSSVVVVSDIVIGCCIWVGTATIVSRMLLVAVTMTLSGVTFRGADKVRCGANATLSRTRTGSLRW